MGIKCSHCGWVGEIDDRVPATLEWIFTGEDLDEGGWYF